MSRFGLFILVLLFPLHGMAASVCLDRDSGRPEDLSRMEGRLSLEKYGPLEAAKVLRVDLNSDGVNEVIVRGNESSCGSGGCFFTFFDGKSGASLGETFGALLFLWKPVINGWPVLETYGHSSAAAGSFVTSVVQGGHYVDVGSVELKGELLQRHFAALFKDCGGQAR